MKVNDQKISSPYARELVEKISHAVTFREYNKNHRFQVNSATSEKVFLIKSGLLSASRQPDDVLLRFFEGPAIRGLQHLHLVQFSYIMKVIKKSEVAVIDYDEFTQLLSRYDLWPTYARHLELSLTMAIEHSFNVGKKTVFDVVHQQLKELMTEPLEVRMSMTAEQYIRGKAKVSRSAVLAILSDLKSGGYITMIKGMLVSIESIPEKY
jgi:CRP-like cAMP-binding protein